VLFANFAEAVAEGRGKAQPDALRRTRTDAKAKKLRNTNSRAFDLVSALKLMPGDRVLVEAGDIIPATAMSSKAPASIG